MEACTRQNKIGTQKDAFWSTHFCLFVTHLYRCLFMEKLCMVLENLLVFIDKKFQIFFIFLLFLSNLLFISWVHQRWVQPLLSHFFFEFLIVSSCSMKHANQGWQSNSPMPASIHDLVYDRKYGMLVQIKNNIVG